MTRSNRFQRSKVALILPPRTRRADEFLPMSQYWRITEATKQRITQPDRGFGGLRVHAASARPSPANRCVHMGCEAETLRERLRSSPLVSPCCRAGRSGFGRIVTVTPPRLPLCFAYSRLDICVRKTVTSAPFMTVVSPVSLDLSSRLPGAARLPTAREREDGQGARTHETTADHRALLRIHRVIHTPGDNGRRCRSPTTWSRLDQWSTGHDRVR